MEIIYQELSQGGHGHDHDHPSPHGHADHGPVLTPVLVRADRRTLAKTRWRAVAEDGVEFGFELVRPLQHGAVIFQSERACYCIEQRPEALFRVAVTDPTQAARVGWMIGNLHFPAQVRDGAIQVEADPALRQMFAREGVAFEQTEGIFRPLHAAGAHHHH